ncbi:MAG: hypothetical protein ACYC27_15620 [Armatimonadota bacterium]
MRRITTILAGLILGLSFTQNLYANPIAISPVDEYIIGIIPYTVLCICVETIVALLMGYRSWRAVIAISLMNLVTNLAANYVVIAGNSFIPFMESFIYFILLEVLVIIVEWRILLYILRGKSRSIFILSLVMNILSFLAGFLIFGM